MGSSVQSDSSPTHQTTALSGPFWNPTSPFPSNLAIHFLFFSIVSTIFNWCHWTRFWGVGYALWKLLSQSCRITSLLVFRNFTRWSSQLILLALEMHQSSRNSVCSGSWWLILNCRRSIFLESLSFRIFLQLWWIRSFLHWRIITFVESRWRTEECRGTCWRAGCTHPQCTQYWSANCSSFSWSWMSTSPSSQQMNRLHWLFA